MRRRLAAAEPRTVGMAAIALSCVILSAGSTLVKETGSPGAVVAMWRLWIATAFWVVYLAATKRRLDRAAFARLAPVGAVYGLNYAVFFSAARMTRIANVEFIGTLAPVVLLPISVLFLREVISRRTAVAGIVAMVGVAIVLFFAPTQVGHNNWAGNLVAIVGVLTWVTYLLLIRNARQQFDTARMMACITIVAAVVATPIGLSSGEAFDVTTKGWVLITLMTITNGLIAHSLIAWSQGRVSVATISLMQLSQPVLAVVWAFLVLDESVRAVQLLGMAVVLAAVAAIGLEATRRAPLPDTLPAST